MPTTIEAPEIIHTAEFTGTRFIPCEYNYQLGNNYSIIKKQEHVRTAVLDITNYNIVTLDTETGGTREGEGLDPFLCTFLTIQIGTPGVVYIFNASLDLTELYLAVVSNSHILKIGQNLKFDYKVIKQKTGFEIKNFFDTMLAERLLTAGKKDVRGKALSASLAGIVQRRLDMELDKEQRKEFFFVTDFNRLGDEQFYYAARDCSILYPVYVKQREALIAEDLMQMQDIESRCAAAVGDMELNGILVDQTKWREMITRMEAQRREVKKELMGMLPGGELQQLNLFAAFGVGGEGADADGYMLNLNSGQQVIEAFGKLGIKLKDTQASTLEGIDHPAARKLVEYKGLEKAISAFGEAVLALIHPVTGRIHADFKQYGADTGRFSCSNPNLQQIPAESDFRECFVPKDGYLMLTSDYGQCELRIIAELSGDPVFYKTFTEGGDPHYAVAGQMFGVDINEMIKTDPKHAKELRSLTKPINFGLAYGMGPQGLSLRINKSKDEAKDLIELYFKQFPKIGDFLNGNGKLTLKRGYSITALGRKRYFDMPEEPEKPPYNASQRQQVAYQEKLKLYREQLGGIERAGKNHPIQGANADMTKAALVFIKEALEEGGYDARLVSTVHDEIVVEVKAEQGEAVKKIVHDAMVRAGELFIKSIPVVADPTLASVWQK